MLSLKVLTAVQVRIKKSVGQYPALVPGKRPCGNTAELSSSCRVNIHRKCSYNKSDNCSVSSNSKAGGRNNLQTCMKDYPQVCKLSVQLQVLCSHHIYIYIEGLQSRTLSLCQILSVSDNRNILNHTNIAFALRRG